MGTLYGDSIFESTISLDTLIESFNNDLLLFDGLLNESVINEGIIDKAKELGHKLSVIIDKVIAKIIELKSKLTATSIVSNWRAALNRADYPCEVRYVDSKKILDYAEEINWHIDNVHKLANDTDINQNKIEAEDDNLGNIYHELILNNTYSTDKNSTRRSSNPIMIEKGLSTKEEAKSFLDKDFKKNAELASNITLTLDKLYNSLNRVKRSIGKMIGKVDKSNYDLNKKDAYSKLWHYAGNVLDCIRSIIVCTNYGLKPHFNEK